MLKNKIMELNEIIGNELRLEQELKKMVEKRILLETEIARIEARDKIIYTCNAI